MSDHSQDFPLEPDKQSANEQIQSLLANHLRIAESLHDAGDSAGISNALAPIASLPEATQAAFLKALSKKEHTVAAADITLAVNMFTPDKEVRKEARRSLLRLQEAGAFPKWSPPSPEALGVAVPSRQRNAPDDEFFDDDDDDDELPSSLAPTLESLFTELGMLMANSEAEDLISHFLDYWSEAEFEDAFELITADSPLLANLSFEEWTEKRELWAEAASPANLRIAFVKERLAPTPHSDEDAGPEQVIVDASWSLEYTEVPSADTIKELPTPTAFFETTNRHWFWTSFTLLYDEEDGWAVYSMTDEGANLLRLPLSELAERAAPVQQLAEEALAETEAIDRMLQGEDEDDDDDDDEDFEVFKVEDDDEDEDEDDDDDDEDFEVFKVEDDDDEDEEEEDDDELDNLTRRLQGAYQVIAEALHYNDALMARTPQDISLYEQSVKLAEAIDDAERAAVYLQLTIQRFPEQRGQAFLDLAMIYVRVVSSYLDDEDTEGAARFADMAESAFRSSVNADNPPTASYILLASSLIAQDKQLDEAASLLEHAQQLALAPNEVTLVETNLAKLAQINRDLELALRHYQRAAELSPDYPAIWFNIGSLQKQLKHYDKAIPNLLRSIQSEPELTPAYADLAAVYMDRDELALAREILQQGLDVNPDAPDLLATLSMAYIQGGDLRTARRYLEQAEDIDDELDTVQAARILFNARRSQEPSRSQGKQQKQHKQHKRNKKKR